MSWRTSLLLSLALLAPALGQEDQVTLRWQLPEGEELHYRFDHEQVMEIQKAEQGGTQRRSRKTEYVLRRADQEGVEAGLLKGEMQLLRLRQRINGPTKGIDRVQDSGTLEEPGDWEEAKPLLRPFEFLIGERGGLREVLSFGGDPLPALPKDQREHLQATLGEGFLHTMAFSLLGEFPAEPLTPGSSWVTSTMIELPTMRAVPVKVTNTFHKVRARQGHHLAVIVQEAVADQNLAAMGLREWSMRGEIEFDIEQGRIFKTSVITRLVVAEEESLVEIDTAQRLIYEDADEGTDEDPSEGE